MLNVEERVHHLLFTCGQTLPHHPTVRRCWIRWKANKKDALDRLVQIEKVDRIPFMKKRKRLTLEAIKKHPPQIRWTKMHRDCVDNTFALENAMTKREAVNMFMCPEVSARHLLK